MRKLQSRIQTITSLDILEQREMKHYYFTVILHGIGNTPIQAWRNVKKSVADNGIGRFKTDNIIFIQRDHPEEDEEKEEEEDGK